MEGYAMNSTLTDMTPQLNHGRARQQLMMSVGQMVAPMIISIFMMAVSIFNIVYMLVSSKPERPSKKYVRQPSFKPSLQAIPEDDVIMSLPRRPLKRQFATGFTMKITRSQDLLTTMR